MKLIEALNKIKKLNISAFHTNDIAISLGITITNASKILKRLSIFEYVIHLKKGLWAMPEIDPLIIANYLLAPLPAYISFYSALYYKNLIDQIPSIIYVATLHKTIKFITPIATIFAHQINPNFFFGFSYDEKTKIKMATSEKALIDTLYLSKSKSKLFKFLPEIDMNEINIKKAEKIIKKIPSKRDKIFVLKKFNDLMNKSS